MSVYIGPLHTCARKRHVCHMVADKASELHGMAGMIGIDRACFQERSGCFSHYTVSIPKRRAAVKLGAVEVIERRLGECP